MCVFVLHLDGFFLRGLLSLMSPYDSGSHDKEPKVDENYRYNWSNEGPDESVLWIQVAPKEMIIDCVFVKLFCLL